jgi:Bacterial Ig-like domain
MPARKVSLDGNREAGKKPSLASLMPDKTPKAVAERAKAVKRMYKDDTQKKATKTKLQTQPKAEKKSRAKTTVVVRAKKPIIEKKAPEKKPQAQRKQEDREEIKVEISANTNPAVVLPERVSVRAQEKVLAILSTLTKDFKQSAEKVSYASGFCFILFGAYLALSFSGVLPQILTPQTAQLLSGTQTNTTQSLSDKAIQARTTIKPTFSLHDQLPPVLDTLSKHTIEVTGAELADASVFSLATGEKFDIGSEKVVDNTFRLTIDPSSLKPARYVLKVVLKSNTDDSKYIFKVGEFEVPRPSTDASTSNDVATSTETAHDDETIEEPDSKEEVVEEPLVEEDEKEEVSEPVTETLSVTTAGSVLSERTVIKVAAPSGARTVELYVRPLRSSTKRFIGLAEKYSGVWQYFFNTKDVPNGEYEIVARTKIDGTFKESSSAKVKIANFIPSPTMAENPTPDDVAAIEPEVAIDPRNGRSFSEVSLYSVVPQDEIKETASSTPVQTTTDIDSVVSLYRDNLENVLERYAVARQSDDPLMLELVERELQGVKKTMVDDVLLDPNLNNLGDDVDVALTERFTDIKRRIDTFEELRKTATERASAIDRDGDGISDFDETNLYQTDADKSDTDNDGVTDGIEIMRGFDPLDPLAEVVVEYEMPQEAVGLVENDLLKVENVSPVIKTDDPTIAPAVQAEIRGKGLPNSFVTIYVFSTPTIVTVRTGEDGSFVYTFEKELEDGEHEVYVAVTDNAGAIMARSNPFKFVKKAEAFSPISGTSAAPTEAPLSGVQVFGAYNVAIGLGILALGMILLMLGATLRERQGFIMTAPKNDVKAS